ncbi:MAG: hypothetical protein HYT16_02340 [DPANN group archaeon]|nr:hypothetical protein [DPANN group archaeon]
MVRVGLTFDKDEAVAIAISSLVLSIALTAGQWGAARFSAAEGLKNIAIAIPAILISLLVHEFAHKISAARYGSATKFSVSWLMLAIAGIVGVLTSGAVIFAAVGASMAVKLKRIGFKYPFVGPHTQAKIALFGPLASLLLAIAAKILLGVFGDVRFLQDLFIFNLWMVFFHLVPFNILPFLAALLKKSTEKAVQPFDGAFILGGNPILYVGFLAFAAVTALTLVFLPFWVALIFGLIAGGAGWVWMHSEDITKLPKVG